MENLYNDPRFKDIEENVKEIREKIAEAAVKSGRTIDDVTLMAVSKTVEPKYINHAIDNCGITLIGENKVQEFLGKREYLHMENCQAHLIGHLQTNKVRQIVGEVSMIQSVDSVRLANEISKQSVKRGITTDVLLEINIGGEESKTGMDESLLTETVHEISEMDGIFVRGLMAIPPICDNSSQTRSFFSQMHQLFIDISNKKIDNINMEILSMGMSGDYVEAILEGSNLVRVGSSLFGARVY